MNNTTRTYTTPAEAAALIRARLKAAGMNSRAVSVRSESFSMGSAIRITIRDLSVSFAAVKLAAEGEEKISRDDNGEILSGSNRYLSIDCDYDAVNAEADKLAALPVAERAFCGRRFYPCDVGTRDESIHVEGYNGRPCHSLQDAVRVAFEMGPVPNVLAAGPVDVAALDALFE